jgi:hypothetical protein
MVTIQWHWFGTNQHALLFFNDSEFLFAKHISQKKADQLVQAGMNHGS